MNNIDFCCSVFCFVLFCQAGGAKVMAVPKNVALSTVTSATSAPQCQSFSSSINTLHTVSGDHSVASCSDLKVKTHLTPAKVIQALPVASGRNSSPQVIRIIKQSEMVCASIAVFVFASIILHDKLLFSQPSLFPVT